MKQAEQTSNTKITKLIIKNFKCFSKFSIDFNDNMNIIVGNNESGKSTILEAIHLALTSTLNGKYLKNDIPENIFNREVVEKYCENPKAEFSPPSIEIELILSGSNMEELAGDAGNSSNSTSIIIKVEFDEDYRAEYNSLLGEGNIKGIPVEYYKVTWMSAARQKMTYRSIPLKSALIDSSNSRYPSGSDIYISRIIKDDLDEEDRVAMSGVFRELKSNFTDNATVNEINNKIANQAKVTNKNINIALDLSTKNAWESYLVTQLDNIPFQYIGKGEQCMIKTKLALAHSKTKSSNVILLEEPENHLSHTKLHEFINSITEKVKDKQIIITTHSAFIANKLKLSNIILLNADGNNRIAHRISDINKETVEFFEKLPGYQTLRLILSKKAILVEGPSDELIVQRSYLDAYNRLPIEDGIDVISVAGLAFKRFLDIAAPIKKIVCVITDNDGNYKDKVVNKYKDYSKYAHIKIEYSEENTKKTLENHIMAENSDDIEKFLNIIRESKKQKKISEIKIIEFMKEHKTDWALKVFKSEEKIKYPEYIIKAIQWIRNNE